MRLIITLDLDLPVFDVPEFPGHKDGDLVCVTVREWLDENISGCLISQEYFDDGAISDKLHDEDGMEVGTVALEP